MTTAENFLYLIKGDCTVSTKLEADLLDLMLVFMLNMEAAIIQPLQ